MKTQNPHLTRRLRISGTLIIAGLIVQAGSLFWNRPLSFLLFVLVGSVVLTVGIVAYLFAIVTLPDKITENVVRSAEVP
ncbi:MAG TPA: hypothetical protein VFP59_13650 [Candidatus Angelobacter sp.]|nr:hypothetical protein [Candidatus Angelobacter sp.]